MATNLGVVLTLANSIMGVSVLAMPFCFKQCGIILSILMLFFSNLITRLACYFLMKSAISERMKNFEMLAFRAYGPHGKLTVEFCIIGFMLGTCVAYFVIMGDLGPAILGPIMGLEHPSALRPSVLIGVAAFVVLPLGLLRNVGSLSAICAASIAFYLCLVLKVIAEATTNVLSGVWMDQVYLWRPSGILQCIPIFSMALSCQTQLFEIFHSVPNTPLDRANDVISSAINLTTLFYMSVGFFGYIAYCHQPFTGNIMLNFSDSLSSDVIKIGFMMSVAVSFPLVIFPCRASMYSFLYSKTQYGHEMLGSAHIPETQFQCITFVIVTCSLVIGIVIPNIELVLGLVGSTMGVFICVITPGMIFVTLSTKRNNERLTAKFIVGVGLIIMVLGTYTNLFATEETLSGPEKHEIKGIDVLDPVLHKIPERIFEKPKDINIPSSRMVKDPVLKALPENIIPKIKKTIPSKVPSIRLKTIERQNEAQPQPVAPEPPVPIDFKVDDHPSKSRVGKPPKEPPPQLPKAVEPQKEERQPVEPVPPEDAAEKPIKLPVVEESKPEKPEEEPKQEQEVPLKKIVNKDNSFKKENDTMKIHVIKPEFIGPKREESVDKVKVDVDASVKDHVKPMVPGSPKVEAKLDNMSLSMAQGVPLPLAIKALDTGIHPEGGAREILQSLDREKRDLVQDVSKVSKDNKKLELNNSSVPSNNSPKEFDVEEQICQKKSDADATSSTEFPPLSHPQKRDLKSLMSPQTKIV